MLLATAQRRSTRSSPLRTIQAPRIWKALPLDDQARVAHALAVLVRRIRQKAQEQDVRDAELA
jgi:hypothetical protein